MISTKEGLVLLLFMIAFSRNANGMISPLLIPLEDTKEDSNEPIFIIPLIADNTKFPQITEDRKRSQNEIMDDVSEVFLYGSLFTYE